MGGSRSKNAVRCAWCRMHADLCICALMPKDLSGSTRLALVMHRREMVKTTNTGLLAVRCLGERAAAFRWGDEGTHIAAEDLVPPGHAGFVLSPVGNGVLDAETVAALKAKGPVAMVVPDGTWRQANKMAKRIPALDALPRYGLPLGASSRYQLRDEPRADGLATFEAIARAIGAIDGPEDQEKLERVFEAMVLRTLTTRGQRPRP